MIKLEIVRSASVVVALMILAACGSGEPTAQELADARRDYEANQQNDLAKDISAFPATVVGLIAGLEALSSRDVSNIEGAMDALRTFDQGARNIRIVERAAAEGTIAVPAESLKASEDLKRVVIRKQRELFPAMRHTYAAHLSDAVAGMQANFRAVGIGAKTLRAASPSFGSREIVMEAHYTLVSQANRFRFNRAEYVYSLSGEYDVIELRGRDDGDIY